MDRKELTCIQVKHIDSFQKLRVLLYLYENPDTIESPQDLAKRLYLGDVTLMEEIIGELHRDGFLEDIEIGYKLCQTPEVERCLRCLYQNFEQPLRRQRLLNEISSTAIADDDELSEITRLEFACEKCSLYIEET